MSDMEDDDLVEGQPQVVSDDAVGNNGNSTKRRRWDNPPTDVDVSGLKGNPEHAADPSRRNRFSVLGNLEIENTDSRTPSRNNRVDGTLSAASKQVDKPFCPPIFLYNVNVKLLVKQLEAKTPKIQFKIKNVNMHKSKLYISDANIHTEMMSLLKEKKINSYSFTPKEHKQISLVLRGLYYSTEEDDIKNALDGMIPEVVAKVSKFSTTFSKKNNLDTGLYLITLKPGKKLSDISHIKFLLSQSVVWEKPKRKEQEIQCRRCQHWGHIARNCNSEYKCVKCVQKHLPNECPRKKTDKDDPICVNCGKSGHPANWRGCPSYKDYVANKRDRIKRIREEKAAVADNVKRALPTSMITANNTFASLFNSQHNPNLQVKRSSTIDKFMELAKYFLEPEELTLEQEVDKFLKEHKKMTPSDAKSEFLRILKKVNNKYGP